MNVVAVVAVVVILMFMVWRSRPDISDTDARKLVSDGATLIDVRSPGEFASGHVGGAKNLPVGEIANRLNEVPRDKPVLLYCRSGARSARAAAVLRDAGYEQVHNLGAMPNW